MKRFDSLKKVSIQHKVRFRIRNSIGRKVRFTRQIRREDRTNNSR